MRLSRSDLARREPPFTHLNPNWCNNKNKKLEKEEKKNDEKDKRGKRLWGLRDGRMNERLIWRVERQKIWGCLYSLAVDRLHFSTTTIRCTIVFISANITANDRTPWAIIASVDYNDIRCAVIQRYRLAALERECAMNPYFAVTLRYLPDRQRHKRLVLRASYSYWSKGSYWTGDKLNRPHWQQWNFFFRFEWIHAPFWKGAQKNQV